jgi:hypothetical protein
MTEGVGFEDRRAVLFLRHLALMLTEIVNTMSINFLGLDCERLSTPLLGLRAC